MPRANKVTKIAKRPDARERSERRLRSSGKIISLPTPLPLLLCRNHMPKWRTPNGVPRAERESPKRRIRISGRGYFGIQAVAAESPAAARYHCYHHRDGMWGVGSSQSDRGGCVVSAGAQIFSGPPPPGSVGVPARVKFVEFPASRPSPPREKKKKSPGQRRSIPGGRDREIVREGKGATPNCPAPCGCRTLV